MKRILLVILTILSINAYAQMSNLIISEYAEGSGGSKKYIELFNGTGTTVDLSNYQILRATNGGGYTVTIPLSGTLANNTTYSIANNATDVPGADLYNTQINHNGDDAFALTWNGGSGSVYTNIDVFGDPLNDPGTGWAVAGVANATTDKILTRKSNVCGPNTNWLAIQGVDPLTSEYFISVGLYNQVNQNTGMGNHVHNCVAPCSTYNTLTATACNSYTLNNQTYTTSGTYLQTLTNANTAGCDSIITLNLTINNANSSTLNITNCGPYTLNNQTYNATGAYTQLTQNIAGCDSTITLNLTIVGSLTYYQDLDNDGYGNAAVSQTGCAAITGYVTNSSDCNDNNNAIYPGAIDIAGNGIDEDCNGFDSPLQLGIYQFTGTVDCATQDVAATNTSSNWTFSDFTAQGNTCESGGGIFNRSDWNQTAFINLNQYNEFSISGANCNNLNLSKLALNHRTSSTGGTPTIFVRSSIDNYATNIDTIASSSNGNVMLTDTISLPATFANLSAVTFRFYVINQATAGSTLRMDNVSLWGNTIAITPTLFYADTDNDGFGDLTNDSLSCSVPVGFVANNTDCNDANAAINPTTVWYMDMDGDLLGDLMSTFTGCTPPTGYVLNSDDCDDTNASVTTPTTYYSDVDQDGFGDDATATDFCLPPPNMVAIGGDCNDNNNAIYPGAPEICDGFDNNCNGTNDEGLIFNTYYLDSDNDQYGAGIGLVSCQAIPLPGYVLVDGDCDDMNPNVYPGATEILDNDLDENCDGVDGYLGLADGYIDVSSINVDIVPNPSNGSFSLNFDSEMTDVIVQITDMSGKALFQSNMSGSSITLNQTQLKPGTYLVHVQMNQQSKTLRLVIQ